MKKLFTLLTLALISIGSAWGDSETIHFFDGTNESASVPSTTNGTITDFTCTPANFKSTLTDVSGYTNASSTYKKGLRYGGGTTSAKNHVKIAVPDGYAATIDIVYSNQATSDVYFGISTDGTKPNGSNCSKWNATAGSQTIYSASIDNLPGNTSYYIGGSTDQCLIVKLDVTITSTRTAVSEALKASAAVKVDDTPLTLDAATSGYSVSGTTITLSDDIAATSTPDNVKLVKTISYDDSSTSDADAAVTFGSTVTDGYYIGTATIGLTGSETSYTVRVKKDVTPTIALTEESGTISLNSYTPTGTVTVTLTGSNLTNGEYTVTSDVAGTTIAPTSFTVENGEVNQLFTITSTASSAASTVFTFGTSDMGIAAPTYTLSYTKVTKRSGNQVEIDAATEWDWSGIASANIQLTIDTDPKKSSDFVLAWIAEIENSETFNSQALVVNGEYAYRKEGGIEFFQGGKISLGTKVAGTVTVEYANTGGNAARTIKVNGIKGSKSSENNKDADYQTESIPVEAGAVTIEGIQVSDDASKQLRIRKLTFTPLTEGDVVKVTDAAYATHVLADDIDFTKTDGVTAYKAQVEGDVIKLTEVEQAPAGTPLIIAATGNVYTLEKATSTPAAVTDNDLVAGPVTGDGSSYYVLGKEGDKVGFGLLASGAELPATKAYISADKFTEARAFIAIDSDVTGIKNIKVGSEDNIYYDLQGRRVLYPTKGLYIVNGKKVILK